MAVELPSWVRELEMSLVTHPQILFVGNVRDQYLLPAMDGSARVHPLTLQQVIEQACRKRGFAALVMFDIVHANSQAWSLTSDPPDLPPYVMEMAAHDALVRDAEDSAPDDAVLRRLRRLLREVVEHRSAPIGMIFPYANRLGSPRAELTGEGKLLMATADALGYEARQVPGPNPVMPYNTIFWIAESQDELPAEFSVSARTVRVITVPKAPADQRLAAARQVISLVGGQTTPDATESDKAARSLARLTHGLSNAEVLTVGRMAFDQGFPLTMLEDAVRLYRVGVRDNPWATEEVRQTIRDGERRLTAGQVPSQGTAGQPSPIGVLGQERAVRRVVDIFMRSAAGLTGAQSSSSPNRPRGVLFLSGPTGVGKTELAKGVARMLFGPDAEPIRFDMSEFRQDHARERLIGAPPGYVGFAAGGELTNAVRANPMCVLLFDEIDKAHESVFDLFLQVLEDGRLTDGRGSTVHFTECVLIFTSNLGMTEPGAAGSKARFTHADDPEEVRRVLRQTFEHFFDDKIGRPELRNRLGDAFIAMDFIQPESVPALLDKSLGSVRTRLESEHHVRLDVSDDARRILLDQAIANLDHGGRGVNNAVESLLIDPLSRLLMMTPPHAGEMWTVTTIKEDGERWAIEVVRCSA